MWGGNVSELINLRPLTLEDIPRLEQIRPGYKSDTVLDVEKSGSGLEIGWLLVERALTQPFDKGTLYDFDEVVQERIMARLERPEDTYQRIAEHNRRLVGLIELEF